MNDIEFTCFSTLVICIFGLYSIHRGWVMSRNPAGVKPSPIDEITIVLVDMIKGESAAEQKRKELLEPDRTKKSSYLYTIMGCALLLGGTLQLVGLVFQYL